jgi:hypothetical protein
MPLTFSRTETHMNYSPAPGRRIAEPKHLDLSHRDHNLYISSSLQYPYADIVVVADQGQIHAGVPNLEVENRGLIQEEREPWADKGNLGGDTVNC